MGPVRYSEMGPVRQNPIQRTVRTAHLSVLMTVHNFQYTIQHSSDNLSSYLQTIIMAQMLSITGEGGVTVTPRLSHDTLIDWH